MFTLFNDSEKLKTKLFFLNAHIFLKLQFFFQNLYFSNLFKKNYFQIFRLFSKFFKKLCLFYTFLHFFCGRLACMYKRWSVSKHKQPIIRAGRVS